MVGHGLRALSRQDYVTQVQVLGYSTKAQAHLGLHFVLFSDLSSSGDQVLGEHTLPRCGASIISLVPAAQFPGCDVSGVPRVSSGEPISGCNPRDGCQPSRIPGRLG